MKAIVAMSQTRETTILSGKKYDLEVILIIAINYSSSFQFLNSGASLFGPLLNVFKLVLLIRLVPINHFFIFTT